MQDYGKSYEQIAMKLYEPMVSGQEPMFKFWFPIKRFECLQREFKLLLDSAVHALTGVVGPIKA